MKNEETAKKLESFLDLKLGWNFGDGVVPSESVVNDALELLRHFESIGFQESDAFPGMDGEARIVLYREHEYYEFTVEVNRSISYLHEALGAEAAYRENLTLKAAKEILSPKDELYCTFTFSTQNTISILDAEDLTVLPFGIMASHPAFQFSTKIVELEPQMGCVHIFEGITAYALQNLQSFGNFRQVSSPKNAQWRIFQAPQGTPAIKTFAA